MLNRTSNFPVSGKQYQPILPRPTKEASSVPNIAFPIIQAQAQVEKSARSHPERFYKQENEEPVPVFNPDNYLQARGSRALKREDSPQTVPSALAATQAQRSARRHPKEFYKQEKKDRASNEFKRPQAKSSKRPLSAPDLNPHQPKALKMEENRCLRPAQQQEDYNAFYERLKKNGFIVAAQRYEDRLFLPRSVQSLELQGILVEEQARNGPSLP
jgi:hypothetical protein